MAQQTAVDWFFNQLPEKTQANNEKEYWQAKAMEKEQIKDAYENGVSDENESNLSGLFTNAEQYYNEPYNK